MSKIIQQKMINGMVHKRCTACKRYKISHLYSPSQWRDTCIARRCIMCQREKSREYKRRMRGPTRMDRHYQWRNFSINAERRAQREIEEPS